MCCRTTDWDIQLEGAAYDRLVGAVRRGHLRISDDISDPNSVLVHKGGTDYFIAAGANGMCSFHDDSNGGSCRVQVQLGEVALPGVCRRYPRHLNPRHDGVVVWLTASCPTVCAVLFENLSDPGIRIVADPAMLPSSALTPQERAMTDVPPLVAEGVFMPWPLYGEWETLVVDTLARDDLMPEQALLQIGVVAECDAPATGRQRDHQRLVTTDHWR